MTERRTARRYDLSLPMTVRNAVDTSAGSRSGRTRDISTRGVYFMMDQDLESGAELDMTLTLPAEITRGTEVLVRAQGRVVRVDRHEEGSNGQSRVGVAAVIERYDIIRGESSTN